MRSEALFAGFLEAHNLTCSYLNIESAKAIHCSMVLPVLTYCGILTLKLNGTQENKLNSFHNRAMQIIAKKRSYEVISPVNAIERRACVLVHNVLRNNVRHPLSQYFTYQEHCTNTRSNKHSVCLVCFVLLCFQFILSGLVRISSYCKLI